MAPFQPAMGGRLIMFFLRMVIAASIAACTSTAVAILPSAAAVQAYGTLPVAPASSRFIQVTNLSNSGPGSFRAAITEVNTTSPGRLTLIRFAVHGTITLASQLPAISRKVTVDATAAPTHVSGGPPRGGIDCYSHPGPPFLSRSS